MPRLHSIARRLLFSCLVAAFGAATVQIAIGVRFASAEERLVPLSAGTGILVATQGQVLTNHHVVGGCSNIFVALPSGDAASGYLLHADEANDLALIKIDQRIADEDIAQFRTLPPVRNGETIAVFGFPMPDILSLQGNITRGNISALAGPGDDIRFYQFTAPIQQGNSGGPLLDEAGNVVGIVTAMLGESGGEYPQNVNFAIKSSLAASFLQANNVKFRNALKGQKQDLPEVADIARRFTVLIVCMGEEAQVSLPSNDPDSTRRLQEFDQREQESARHDPPRATPLRELYDAYTELTDEDLANAGPLAPRISSFADQVEESQSRLAAFAAEISDVESEEAFRAYDSLTLFDKILYRVMAPDDVFIRVCEAEGNLALQSQQELRLCRDPSQIVVVNGAWGQRSVAAARQFLEDAKYWEWIDEDIDLTVPSVEFRDLVHKVRMEGYGPICTSAGARISLPRINVAGLCQRWLVSR